MTKDQKDQGAKEPDHIRVRFGDQETGQAERISPTRARINNIPLKERLNIDDVCVLKKPGDDGFYKLGQVVERSFEEKTYIKYFQPFDANFSKLRAAFLLLRCKVEGYVPGLMAVAHNKLPGDGVAQVASDLDITIEILGHVKRRATLKAKDKTKSSAAPSETTPPKNKRRQ